MITYDIQKYLQYMELPVIDEAKKNIELKMMEGISVNLQHKSLILDIGTATARYPIFFATKGHEVIGIDIIDDSLELSHKNVNMAGLTDKIKLLKMNGTSLEFEANSFDLVTCMMGTVCHLTEEEKKDLFREVQRVLKKNGMFVFTSWNPNFSMTSYLSFYTRQERALLKKNSQTPESLREMLLIHGLIPIQEYSLIPFSDEQLLQLELEDGFTKLQEVQRYCASQFPKLQGQLHAFVYQKSGHDNYQGESIFSDIIN
ncbi:ubiquinone/menaquinone biosynthesis C-methylase UbiE [Paenibacillus sp. DS2015]|uniref:class I SAM-dependent methyltransferase n=1 Tax=Paenibacillus sp. DS2015 TaxID=3373917 RepID=UPI003D1E0EA5